MRMTAAEIGFFEDYEGDEVLEVGIAGTDDSGEPRSFSFQRATYEPDEQDVQCGMDSYCVSTELGFTVYGCLRGVRLTETLLTLEFAGEDAEILKISTPVEVELAGSGVDVAELAAKLREILVWGAEAKRPDIHV